MPLPEGDSVFAGWLTIATTALVLCTLAFGILVRFRPADSDDRGTGGSPDWIVLLLPTLLTIQLFREKVALLALGLLVAWSLVRKPEGHFRVQAGPLSLLFASSLIVLTRPTGITTLATFVLLSILVIRLITTTDARRILTSLIDGCGLFLLASVATYAIGMRSPAIRLDNLADSSGFVRIIFPLSSSINIPPIIAAIYVTAFVFLFWEQGGPRRWLRIACLPAAGAVLIGGGTRPMVAAPVLILIALFLAPSATRWIAQAATILAAGSAFLLPTFINSSVFRDLIEFVASLTPTRTVELSTVSSFGGREFIWRGALHYWNGWVDSAPTLLLGFGQSGPYKSGAYQAYREELSWLVRNPELATLHNSALQQLFDGGILGLLLLFFAIMWASMRLARRQRDWGNLGIAAVTTLTILSLSAITEASLAPGPGQHTFWLFMVVIGIACQSASDNNGASDTAGNHPLGQTAHHRFDFATTSPGTRPSPSNALPLPAVR